MKFKYNFWWQGHIRSVRRYVQSPSVYRAHAGLAAHRLRIAVDVRKLIHGDPGAGMVGRAILTRKALRLGKGDGLFVGEHGRRPMRAEGADAVPVLQRCRNEIDTRRM